MKPAHSIALALAILMAGACGASQSQRATRIAIQLDALDGGIIHLNSYRGRVVVLHLFTTWSLAAQTDLPQLTEAHEQYGDELAIIGVALDPDGFRVVAPWRKENAIAYLVALGSDLMAGKSAMGPIAQVPTTVVLKRDHTVAARIDGPLRPGQLADLVRDALGPGQ